MAASNVGSSVTGAAVDPQPSGYELGSLYTEHDTGKVYVWNGSAYLDNNTSLLGSNNTWTGTNTHSNWVLMDTTNELRFRDASTKISATGATDLTVDIVGTFYVNSGTTDPAFFVSGNLVTANGGGFTVGNPALAASVELDFQNTFGTAFFQWTTSGVLNLFLVSGQYSFASTEFTFDNGDVDTGFKFDESAKLKLMIGATAEATLEADKWTFEAGAVNVGIGFGTSGQFDITVGGNAVVKVTDTVLTFGRAAAGVDYDIKIDGETNDGILRFMEDEDRFKLVGNGLELETGEFLYFGGTSSSIRESGGIFFINAQTLFSYGIGGTPELLLSATELSPNAAGGLALGTASLPFSDIFSNGKIQTTGSRLALVGNAGDPASLVNGDIFLDTTDAVMKTKRATLATGVPFVTTFGRNTADSSAISNTTSETNFDVNLGTILASTVKVGSRFWIWAGGKLSTTGAPTIQLRIKLGTVAILTTAAATTNTTTTDEAWYIQGMFTVRATGASGTVMASGHWNNGRSDDALGNASTITIDWTAAQLVQVSAQWGALSVLDTIVLQDCGCVEIW